jgi:SAM-dependent methyltransferase
MSPLCESFVPPDRAEAMEPFFPLHVRLCAECFLVQLPAYVAPGEIFSEYAYFSSYSSSWVEHARRYAEAMVGDLGLDESSLVVEVGSNDGYLLQHFVAAGIPVLGVEPAANVAEAAEERGVRTRVDFFGAKVAASVADEHGLADLIAGNNVLAQVPDVNDFVAGVARLLSERGLATFEFPHLLRLMEENQYDTIYHEHFSYFSLHTVRLIMAAHGLEVVDAEELPSHGGSLRLHVAHAVGSGRAVSARVNELAEREDAAGVTDLDAYSSFQERVEECKRSLLSFLIDAKRDGKSIAGYGAPGKGNTLLNYCGIRTDFVDYTVDRNPYKHGLLLPGSRIPIFDPSRLDETRPDYILILPWNLKKEIVEQLAYTKDWGAQFVVPIPKVEVVR